MSTFSSANFTEGNIVKKNVTISQLTNLCKTLGAAILLTSSTHFGALLGAFFY